VAETQHAFTYCPYCDRVTWPATHWENMQRRLAETGFSEAGLSKTAESGA
jgi:uncharacterized protein with PIN domain